MILDAEDVVVVVVEAYFEWGITLVGIVASTFTISTNHYNTIQTI
jgi:hypothetical protein